MLVLLNHGIAKVGRVDSQNKTISSLSSQDEDPDPTNLESSRCFAIDAVLTEHSQPSVDAGCTQHWERRTATRFVKYKASRRV
jgi:hypothetical protein